MVLGSAGFGAFEGIRAQAICCRERMDSLAVRFTDSKPLVSRRLVAGSTNWADYSPGPGSVRQKGSKGVPDNKQVEADT